MVLGHKQQAGVLFDLESRRENKNNGPFQKENLNMHIIK